MTILANFPPSQIKFKIKLFILSKNITYLFSNHWTRGKGYNLGVGKTYK